MPGVIQELGDAKEAALILNQAKPASKQLNLKGLSDGDGFQKQWLSDAGRTNS